jgi:hypothetical protein
MKRALFVCVAMSAWAPLIAFGQSAQKMPRLCFLTFDPPAARTTKFAEFFDGLRGLGLIDVLSTGCRPMAMAADIPVARPIASVAKPMLS